MFNRVFASRFDYWLSRRDVGAAKINKSGFTRFFYFAKTPQPDTPECQQKTQFSWATPTSTHGEYENTQLEKS